MGERSQSRQDTAGGDKAPTNVKFCECDPPAMP
jgi:hypothetical protein